MILSQKSVAPAKKAPKEELQPWMRAGILFGMYGVLVVVLLFGVNKAIFGGYWSSGTAIARGMNPYSSYPLTAQEHFFAPGQTYVIPDINLNPPCLLPVLQVMSHLTLARFAIAWTIGSAFFLVAAIALLLRDRPAMQLRQLVWLALSTGVSDTLSDGQIYFFLLFLSTLAWIFSEKKQELAASVALGLLVALKPTAVFWPFFLFLSGRRSLCVRSLCVTALTSILPLALYGPTVYRQWIGALANDPHWIIPTDVSVPAYFARLGVKNLGLGLAGLITVWLGYTVWKRKPPLVTTSGIALCATILCAPLAWVAYILMLAPVFVARRWGKVETTGALLLMIPSGSLAVLIRSGSRMGLVAAGTGYFIAVWLILICFLRGTHQNGRTCDQPSLRDGVFPGTAAG